VHQLYSLLHLLHHLTHRHVTGGREGIGEIVFCFPRRLVPGARLSVAVYPQGFEGDPDKWKLFDPPREGLELLFEAETAAELAAVFQRLKHLAEHPGREGTQAS